MFTQKNLHIISVEGNWDRGIHDQRIADASVVLTKDPSSFVIASGTFAPSPYSSFFQGRLGEYTKKMLINKYNIPAMRILPAFLFPYRSTYTIIDAFANATLIGWISCGLKKRSEKITVLFEPITSEFHGLRVEKLNTRACKYLKNFNVDVQLSCKKKLSSETLKADYKEEIFRLSEMQSANGILTTGKWLDNKNIRSYDNLHNMKRDLTQAFNAFSKFSLSHINPFLLSDFERLIFTLSWNQFINTKKISDKEFDLIYEFIKSNFDINTAPPKTLTRKIKNITLSSANKKIYTCKNNAR